MMLNNELKILTIRELLNSLPTILRDWKFHTPFWKFCYFYCMGRTAYRVIGIPLFQKNQSRYWYSHLTFVLFVVHFVCTLYTAVYYLRRQQKASQALA